VTGNSGMNRRVFDKERREWTAPRTDRGRPPLASRVPPVAQTPAPPASPSPSDVDPAASPVSLGAEAPFPRRHLDKQICSSLAFGLALAGVVASVPALKFVFSYLTIVIHELGHAVFGWLFGYVSIPAFDFRYGGGVTFHQQQSVAILVGFYLLMAALFALYRRNRLTLAVLAGAVVVHGLLAYTRGHRVLILFMGHGTEVLLAGVFLYRALSGSAVRLRIERPLYAFCGFFILICDVIFALGLITNPLNRARYESARAAGHWMDFRRIAEHHLHVDLSVVAAVLLVCCVVAPVLSFLAFRYQARLRAALWRILKQNPRAAAA